MYGNGAGIGTRDTQATPRIIRTGRLRASIGFFGAGVIVMVRSTLARHIGLMKAPTVSSRTTDSAFAGAHCDDRACAVRLVGTRKTRRGDAVRLGGGDPVAGAEHSAVEPGAPWADTAARQHHAGGWRFAPPLMSRRAWIGSRFATARTESRVCTPSVWRRGSVASSERRSTWFADTMGSSGSSSTARRWSMPARWPCWASCRRAEEWSRRCGRVWPADRPNAFAPPRPCGSHGPPTEDAHGGPG